jgi:thiamine-phosphate pyrophosphorylase
VQLYAITDRGLFSSHEALIKQSALWARGGVDYIQIREKDLAPSDLFPLAAGIVSAVRSSGGHARVLLNGPAETAVASGCDGVHLPAGQSGSAIAAARVVLSKLVVDPVVSVSSHTLSDVERARDLGATLVIFAPVFEKRSGTEMNPGQGLHALAAACRVAGSVPVFALGGVTARNAQPCVDAGAAGIAAIRLFASEGWLGLRRPLTEEPHDPQDQAS